MNPKRSNSRFFFESSLELKCLFFFGLALAVVITVSCLLYFKVTKNQIDTQNPLMGKMVSEREFLLMHLRVLLKNESGLRSGSDSDARELDDFIDSMASQSAEITGRQATPPFQCRLLRTGNYRSKNNEDKPHNEFESKLIETMLQVPPVGQETAPPVMIERTDNEGTYNYYQILRMERSCLNCHQQIMGDQSADIGSLLGIIHVTIPEPPARKEITRLWALLLGAGVITAFLALLAFYVVIRYVVSRPLKKLREASEAITNGDITKRADLHTGDEFEALGAAFNRMLQYLVQTQEELHESNLKLAGKVDELATSNLQLFEMNRIKSDFMATMSHELRTPLNSILGFSDVLGANATLTDKQRRFVENINNSGKALLVMINNILDLAKIEAGRLEFQLSQFSIDDIVSAQCNLARPLAEKKNLELVPDLTSNLPMMRQDAGRIQQILNNLISNAIKYTPEGGSIRIEVRKITKVPLYPRGFGTAAQTGRISSAARLDQIDFLQMKVIDSGVGISKDELQVIFEKFRQGTSSRGDGDTITREYNGSGLGLSIVKELSRLLEGDVEVESQPGFGSTFTVYLPWILNPPTRTESPMLTEIQRYSHEGITRKGTVTYPLPPEKN